jgi:hypothetical protein
MASTSNQSNQHSQHLQHLQVALNKVVDEVSSHTIEGFVAFMKEYALGTHVSKDHLDDILHDYLATRPSSCVFNFGSKKREKKTRPPNSYNMFIREKMREIKLANPDFKGKELMKRATQEWNKQKAENAQAVQTASPPVDA